MARGGVAINLPTKGYAKAPKAEAPHAQLAEKNCLDASAALGLLATCPAGTAIISWAKLDHNTPRATLRARFTLRAPGETSVVVAQDTHKRVLATGASGTGSTVSADGAGVASPWQ